MARTRTALIGLPPLVFALGLSSTALSAPTCQDIEGRVARCGTEKAMPVGWSPSTSQVFDRRPTGPESPGLPELVAMLYVVGAVFALIALMPPFDGRNGEDWDEQEGDDQPR